MKTIYYLSIALLALTACSQPENKTIEQPADTLTRVDTESMAPIPTNPPISQPPDPIMEIRQQVTAINTAKLETKHTEFKCDELMTVDQLFHDGKLVKVAIDFGWIGDAHAKEDYYYDEDGQVIFFYEFVEGGPACEGCIKTNEYRSYVNDGKVIKYLKNQTPGTCRKCEFGPGSKPARLYTARTAEELKGILCR